MKLSLETKQRDDILCGATLYVSRTCRTCPGQKWYILTSLRVLIPGEEVGSKGWFRVLGLSLCLVFQLVNSETIIGKYTIS